MARLAGDNPGYRWALLDPLGQPTEYVEELPSVTTVIKAVMGASTGGFSYWGFRLGIVSQHPDLDDQEIDALYESAKGGKHAPNRQRDEGGSRGNKAHAMGEALARGELTLPRAVPTDGYQTAVRQFWARHLAGGWEVIAAEEPVWSFEHGVQGTPDLVRGDSAGNIEVVDYKTHKPARGRKSEPAYVEDLYQLAAYEGLFKHRCYGDYSAPQPIGHRVVILKSDGTYLEDTRWVDPRAFLDVLKVYQHIKQIGGGDK